MSWLSKLFRAVGGNVNEIAEEKAKDALADLVREVNEEAGQWLRGEGSTKLSELLASAQVPEALWPILAPAIIGFACEAVEKPLQSAVNKAQTELEKINAGDAPTPAPVVNLDSEPE